MPCRAPIFLRRRPTRTPMATLFSQSLRHHNTYVWFFFSKKKGDAFQIAFVFQKTSLLHRDLPNQQYVQAEMDRATLWQMPTQESTFTKITRIKNSYNFDETKTPFCELLESDEMQFDQDKQWCWFECPVLYPPNEKTKITAANSTTTATRKKETCNLAK
jgi:hypothetical protein